LPSLKLNDGSTLKLARHGEKIIKGVPEEVGNSKGNFIAEDLLRGD